MGVALPAVLLGLLASPLSAGTARGGLTERDAFGGFAELRVSEHFALKWGEGFTLSEGGAQSILDQLELSWTTFVDDFGMKAASSTMFYLHNVYITDSFAGAPSEQPFAAGYFSLDSEGYPFIAFSREAVDPEAGTELGLCAHEFFHSIQMGATEDGLGPHADWAQYDYAVWLVEAGASWAASVVDPDYVGLAPSYLTTSNLALSVVEEFSVAGAPRQYGAFLFLRHLSDHHAEPELVTGLWTEAASGRSALEILDDALVTYGIGVEAAFGGFPERNIAWDYSFGSALREVVANALASGESHWSETWGPLGTGGWQAPPVSKPLNPFGYHLLVIERPADGEVTVRFEAEAQAEEPAWWVRVHRIRGDTRESTVLIDGSDGGTEGSLTLQLTGEDALVLSVAATSLTMDPETELPYRYSIDIDGDLIGTGGCACGTTGGRSAAPGAGLVVLGLLGMWRRRRDGISCSSRRRCRCSSRR